jgi:hypothetical protein
VVVERDIDILKMKSEIDALTKEKNQLEANFASIEITLRTS